MGISFRTGISRFSARKILGNLGDVGANANMGKQFREKGIGWEHAKATKTECPGTLHHAIGRGIDKGEGRGPEEIRGESAEDFLPSGGQEICIFRSQDFSFFRGDCFLGQSVFKHRKTSIERSK
jgi:hypothetical protein